MATQLSFGPRFEPRSAPVTFWLIVGSIAVSAGVFLGSGSPAVQAVAQGLFVYQPGEALARPWSAVLYPLLNLQSPFWFLLMAWVLWWCGSDLEGWWGSRIHAGVLVATTVGGALMASLATALRPDAGAPAMTSAALPVEVLLCVWGLRNPTRQVILLFVPVPGRVIALISAAGVWFGHGPWHGLFVMLGSCGLATLYLARGKQFHLALHRLTGDPAAREARRRDRKFKRLMARSGLRLVDDDDEPRPRQ